MNTLKAGDLVKNKDGSPFTHGEHVATIRKIGRILWLEETNTYAHEEEVKLVSQASSLDIIQAKINDLQKELDNVIRTNRLRINK
jgi:hypothetical protein